MMAEALLEPAPVVPHLVVPSLLLGLPLRRDHPLHLSSSRPSPDKTQMERCYFSLPLTDEAMWCTEELPTTNQL